MQQKSKRDGSYILSIFLYLKLIILINPVKTIPDYGSRGRERVELWLNRLDIRVD